MENPDFWLEVEVVSAIRDAIVSALEEVLGVLFGPIEGFIEAHANEIVDVVVSTPRPDTVFGAPTNGPWTELYAYYWSDIVPIAILVWALSVGIVILLETTGHLFSGYHQTRLKKRVFVGLLGILSWWWLAALSLRFASALTGVLLPDLSEVSLFQTLSFTGMGVLGLVISLTVDFVLFALIAVIYFVRRLTLYVLVLGMPIMIALWVPGIGPFALVSRFMGRLAGFYVPLLFMTFPIALLFRVGGVLGESFELSMGGLGAWLTALVIPLVAVLSPFIFVWQASALFFVGGRMASHTSRDTARGRTRAARSATTHARDTSRNFQAGLQGTPATDPGSGRYLLDSTQSRAHSLGTALRNRGRQVRDGVHAATPSTPPGTGTTGDGNRVDSGQPDVTFPALNDRRDGGPAKRRNQDSRPSTSPSRSGSDVQEDSSTTSESSRGSESR